MNNNENGNPPANEGGGLFSRLGSMLFSYRSAKPSVEDTTTVEDNVGEGSVQGGTASYNNNNDKDENNKAGPSQEVEQNQVLSDNANTISTPFQANKKTPNAPLFTPPSGIELDTSTAPTASLFTPPSQANLSDGSPNVLDVGFADGSFADEINDTTQLESDCVRGEEDNELKSTFVMDDNSSNINKGKECTHSQPVVVGDEIGASIKSYKLDFDQFDDPNFNPFQTNSAVRNSPEPQDNFYEAKEQASEICASQPLATSQISTGVEESAEADQTAAVDDSSLQAADEDEGDVLNNGFNASDLTLTDTLLEGDLTSTLTSGAHTAGTSIWTNEDVSSTREDSQANDVSIQEDDVIINVPNKSYSFDLDQFDDPNFDPFRTKTAVRNSPEPPVTSGRAEMTSSPPPPPEVSTFQAEVSTAQLVEEEERADDDGPAPGNDDVANRQVGDDVISEVTRIQHVADSTSRMEIDDRSCCHSQTVENVEPEKGSQESPHHNGAEPDALKQVVPPVLEVVTPAPEVEIPAPEAHAEDEIIVPKKSYNFDFDKFDDPNFNPFQTKTAVRNSPEPPVTSGQAEVTSSPPPEAQLEEEEMFSADDQPRESLEMPVEGAKEEAIVEPKTEVPVEKEPEVVTPAPEVVTSAPEVEIPAPEAGDEDEIIVPKKSYNFDFDKFDDPNFNPFQTKTAVRNSPEPPVTSGQAEVTSSPPPVTSGRAELPDVNDETFKVNDDKSEESNRMQNEVISPEMTSECDDKLSEIVEPQNQSSDAHQMLTEAVAVPGSDNLDFDDPNFDPFRTKSAVRNSPEPQLTSGRTEMTSSPEMQVKEDAEVRLRDEADEKPQEIPLESAKEEPIVEAPVKKEPEAVAPVPEVEIPAPEAHDEDEIVVPKKSYNFDFDKFDDPNFNPFQTKTAVRNSPEPPVTSGQAEVTSSPPPPPEVQAKEDAEVLFNDGEKQQESPYMPVEGAKEEPIVEPKTEVPVEKEPEVETSAPEMEIPAPEAGDEDEIIVPNKSYNFDFDKFDDPNFNPFQTKTAVRNSPEPPVTSGQAEVTSSPPVTSGRAELPDVNDETFPVNDDKSEESNRMQNEVRSPEMTSESEIPNHQHQSSDAHQMPTEAVAAEAPGSDNLDFDDPDFDPFRTKSAVCNSPEPRLTSGRAEMTSSAVRNSPADDDFYEALEEPEVVPPPLTTSQQITSGAVDDSLRSDDNLLNDGFNASDPADETTAAAGNTSSSTSATVEAETPVTTTTAPNELPVPAAQQQASPEDEIIVPKKSYNFDFDKFDDPNFNPFQTKTAVRNSPEPPVTSGQAEVTSSPPEVQLEEDEMFSADDQPRESLEMPVEGAKEEAIVEPKTEVPVEKEPEVVTPAPEVVTPAPEVVTSAPEMEMPAPGAYDEDEIIVPKKSYNFDFDKFDDPNFNPFQTKTAVRNSPEPPLTSGRAEPLTRITSGREESGNNEKPEAPDEQSSSQTFVITEDNDEKKIAAGAADESKKRRPVTKKKAPIRKKAAPAAKKPEAEIPAPPEVGDEDEIIVPKKSYNFDFDKFDDPNFNPFQTKTAIRNSPEPSGQAAVTSSPPPPEMRPRVEDAKPPQESFEIPADEAKKAPARKKPPLKKKKAAPVRKRKDFDFRLPVPEAGDEDEVVVPKKSYNFDFDKFDDPNFNPFQTKTAVRNSPEPEVTSSPPEVNPPTIVSGPKEEEEEADDRTSAAEKSKPKSKLGGLRRPIAKRATAAAVNNVDNTDEEESDPFVSRNAMQNSPPPPSMMRADVAAGGDAAGIHRKEQRMNFEEEFGGNYTSADGSSIADEESSADVLTSTKLERPKNLNQGDATERLSESEEMSVDSLPAAAHPDFVQPEVVRGGLPRPCRDDQVTSMSAFRPFNVVRDEVEDKSLVARYELLQERKLRLNQAIRSTRKHKTICESASESLEELIKNKSQQITQVTAEYRGKLDDFYHVRAQIHGFTCRESDIQNSISRIGEENRRLADSLEKRKRGYMASYLRLTNQLSNDHELIKGLREEQDCRAAELRDEFSLLEAKLKKAQIQVSSLESNLHSKSQQCDEMGKLCDELFTSAELNNVT